MPVSAATINVNSGCTLAQAITAANTNATPTGSTCTAGSATVTDTINLAGISGTLTLTAALSAIASNITIEGAGKTISGNNAHRIFHITSGTVRINDLTMMNGKAPRSDGFEFGGAVYNQGGTLTVSKSSFIDNVTIPNASNCNETDDYGGAIFTGGTLTVLDSAFRGNRSSNTSGIRGSPSARITIRRSSFTGHGIPDEPAGLTDCASDVLNFGEGGELSNVTISNNSAGALWLSDNQTTIIRHSTIVNNTSLGTGYIGGLGQTEVSSARAQLYNNIIADNSPVNCGGNSNLNVWITANVNNLVKTRIVETTDSGGNTIRTEHDDCGTPAYSDDPMLASFRGSPGYHPLRQGSPAIDAVTSTASIAQCNALSPKVDIRNIARPVGLYCDLGAYEGVLVEGGGEGGRRGGSGNGGSATPTPLSINRSLCFFCPELLAQGFGLRATYGLNSGVQFRQVGRDGIGNQAVLNAGFMDAVDVYGYAEQGVEVCFPGSGSVVLLDATTSPRAPASPQSYSHNGKTCATIDRPGTLGAGRQRAG